MQTFFLIQYSKTSFENDMADKEKDPINVNELFDAKTFQIQ